jgi:hypothetical protein
VSERLPLVFAVAKDIKAALEPVDDARFVGECAGMPGVLFAEHHFFCFPLGAFDLEGAGKGERALYLCSSSPDDLDVGAKLFRVLRLAAEKAPDLLAGPWSPLEFVGLAPHAGEAIFGRGEAMHLPWCIEGMSPELHAKIDYRPSKVDCERDTPPDKAALLAPLTTAAARLP